jgi:hypothetical protein
MKIAGQGAAGQTKSFAIVEAGKIIGNGVEAWAPQGQAMSRERGAKDAHGG